MIPVADLIAQRNEDMAPYDGQLIPFDENSALKVLRLTKGDKRAESIDFRQMLASTVQLFSAADIVSKIQTGMEYVVQVPAKYQKELASGALEMMHGEKSGKTWATIVRKLADGRQEIIDNCPITEEMRLKGSPVETMAGVYQNLYMQQKLAELSAQVQEVYEVVKRIEQGQMDDRIGKLISGRNDLQRALKNADVNARQREMEFARDKISEALWQIGQVFKSRIENFAPIDASPLVRIFREIASARTNYMSKKDEEFQNLQEYFEFYLRSTELLASSYAIVGDIERADMVYQQSRSFLQGIDYSRVTTLDHLYPKDSMLDAFYHKADQFIEDEKQLCLEEAKPFDYIQLTVTGEDLMEVLEYVEEI